MRRCIQTHTATGFGRIPAGSLWADDSPFIGEANAEHFVPVEAVEPEPVPRPRKKAASRKFGEKKVADG